MERSSHQPEVRSGLWVLNLWILHDILKRISHGIFLILEALVGALQGLIKVLLLEEVAGMRFDQGPELILLSRGLGNITSMLYK